MDLPVQYFVILAYAWDLEGIARVTGNPILITVGGVRTSHLKRWVSANKAMRELGATFRPFEETLRDEVAYYRSQA